MELMRDIRFALRALRRRPGVVAAVICTLALGIGANTAVFTLVDAVLLHPLAVAEPDRLVAIYETSRQTPYAGVSLAVFREFESRSRTLSAAAAFYATRLRLEADRRLDVRVAFATDAYFTTLGIRPAIGHVFGGAGPGRAESDGPLVAVLSDGLWRTAFGADSGVVGRTIRLRGQPFTVIGVAPAHFRGTSLTSVPELWVPVSAMPLVRLDLLSMNGALNLEIPLYSAFGRLRPGATLEQAAAELDVMLQQERSAGRHLAFRGLLPRGAHAASVVPLVEGAAPIRSRDTLRRFVDLLLGVVALTLVLACLNIANLLIVRGRERAREMGIRAALGATRGRLARQLFVESLLLALAGGAAGVGVGLLSTRALKAFALPGGIDLQWVELRLSPRVLLFALGATLTTALAFGLAPALRAGDADVLRLLRRENGARTLLRGRGALLALQVALSLMLAVGASLFLRSVRAGLTTDIGFDPEAIAAVSVAQKWDGTHAAAMQQYRAGVDAVAALPGVTAAAATSHIPLASATAQSFRPAAGEGTAAPSGGDGMLTMGVAAITEDFFRVLGVPLVAGREFTRADGPRTPKVIVLNQSAARALFPGRSPLGQRLASTLRRSYTVVGVVRDTKYRTLMDDGVPFAYLPMDQGDFIATGVSFVARAARPRAILGMLPRAVQEAAPELMASDRRELRPRLVSDQVSMYLAPQRFGATLLTGFALLALAVSSVGIWGTVSYIVSRRTTEIGIRMALGARGANVLSLVLRQTGMVVAAGALAGLAGAAFATRLAAHYLYAVQAMDAAAFGAAIVVVTVTALLAAAAPSRRAVRIDPVSTMREL